MYFTDKKRTKYPRICGMKNPKAANEMIVTLAAGRLAGGYSGSTDSAIHAAAEAVEYMLRVITGEDTLPGIDHLLKDADVDPDCDGDCMPPDQAGTIGRAAGYTKTDDGDGG